MGREAGTSTVLGLCAIARARRSSSVLKGTCSGFGTMPLDTVENRHVSLKKKLHSLIEDFCSFRKIPKVKL